jgi:hypothetical protein
MGLALLSRLTLQGFNPIGVASITKQFITLLSPLKKGDLMGVFCFMLTVVTFVLAQVDPPE